MLAIIENKWDKKHVQILPAPTEGATENIGEGLLELHYLQIYVSQRKPSSTQSSSRSSSVSLFCVTPLDYTPPHVYIRNSMQRQVNQIYYQAIYRS